MVLTLGWSSTTPPPFKNKQVLARSSPEDKFLLVTRLNGGDGGAMPPDREAWEAMHPDKSWDADKVRSGP